MTSPQTRMRSLTHAKFGCHLRYAWMMYAVNDGQGRSLVEESRTRAAAFGSSNQASYKPAATSMPLSLPGPAKSCCVWRIASLALRLGSCDQEPSRSNTGED